MTTYCREYGHEHYRLPCKGCRAESLEVTTDAAPIARLTPEQAATNARGARAVIAAFNVNRTSAREATP